MRRHQGAFPRGSTIAVNDEANDATTFIDSSPQVTTRQRLCLFCDPFEFFEATRKCLAARLWRVCFF